jgi:hypothetical protein
MIHTYMEISQGKPLCNYLYLKLKCVLFVYLFSFFSYKIREQEGEEVAPAGGGSSRWGKEDRKVNTGAIKCVHM